MKILEERCDIITNMEVMLLLVQQQQLLPSVESLLRQASKPNSVNSGSSTANTGSHSEARKGNDREDGASGQSESGVEHLRLDHVKELLYQHMFNQMVQDYIRKTCPYLHLVRAPADPRLVSDRSRCHTAVRSLAKRPAGAQGGSRRATGITGIRSGGVSPLINRRVRECLDFLFHRYGLTELELLTILNLGAFKPVEIYMYLDDCSSRFTEDDAAEMLGVIDLALVQQQPLPPLPPDTTAPMDVDSQAEAQKAACASSEPGDLQQHPQEMQSEAGGLEPQRQQAQNEADHPTDSKDDAEPSEEKAKRRPVSRRRRVLDD
ncbi:hypothetical protein, conserved [Eimeria brunetti]|uniref:DNA-directed RNA polymerase III subunit RPC9 n=1 Tax=Eimeria brunetti TaxID=51314 RepID=U6LLL8_9EIME|nr:hypothetical protein, conserved [Eimeria brunetti]